MPTPRSHEILSSSSKGKAVLISAGPTRVLFYDGPPIAIATTGGDIFLLDMVHSPAATKAVNELASQWSSGAYITRTAPNEFDFMLATSLMSQLRTLTRNQPNAEAAL